jgi:hypothetical protein
MKKQMIVAAALCTAFVAGNAAAAVNCGIVNRDLKMGRTPQDISERMGVPVSDVNACKGKNATETTGKDTATTGETAPKGIKAPTTGQKAEDGLKN